MIQVRTSSRAAALGALLLVAASPCAFAAGATERASVTSDERQANGGSSQPSLSGDGRLVVFETTADNLGSPRYGRRIVLRDRAAGTTTPVDVGPTGDPPAGGSGDPLISRDGRFVAFSSSTADLVPGDTNGVTDVFVRDLAAGTIVRASVKSNGREIRGDASFGRAISADGRFVVFQTGARAVSPGERQVRNVLVRDLRRGRTTLETVAPDGGRAESDSFAYSISADGRFLSFRSTASNLVANDRNGHDDVFVRDRRTGRTVLVSVATGGARANGDSTAAFVSDDGSVVAFDSFASNLAPGDAGQTLDVFVRDLRAGTTERISAGLGGDDPDAFSYVTGISADGSRVIFESQSPNLVPGDTNGRPDVFVYDRRSRTLSRVNVAASGAQVSGFSGGSDISADGGTVAFGSSAANVVPGDTNGDADVFVRVLGR